MRGPGFYSIDYEMRIDIDNLVLGIIGDRDVQAVCGYGCGSGYSTGANGMNAYGNVTGDAGMAVTQAISSSAFRTMSAVTPSGRTM